MTQPAISVSEVTKRYTSRFGRSVVTALDGVWLRVEPGEIFGLLGPNGAGKTTTVKILLGLTHADRGRGLDSSACRSGDPESRRRVGYLPGGAPLPGLPDGARRRSRSSAGCRAVGRRRCRERIPELLERVRLSDWADVRVKKFSKGMTQRLGPRRGARRTIRTSCFSTSRPTAWTRSAAARSAISCRRRRARGRAILLNSHLLSEIERTCDRVAVLRSGRVVARGAHRGPDAPRGSRYRLVATGVDERAARGLPRDRRRRSSASTGTSI